MIGGYAEALNRFGIEILQKDTDFLMKLCFTNNLKIKSLPQCAPI